MKGIKQFESTKGAAFLSASLLVAACGSGGGGGELVSGGGSGGGNEIPVLQGPLQEPEYWGEWSACYNDEDSAVSTLRTLVLNDDKTWQQTDVSINGSDCDSDSTTIVLDEAQSSGTYRLGDESVLPNGLAVREFDYIVAESSDSAAELGSYCYSFVVALGGILLSGEESEFNDCASPSARHEIVNMEMPLFSDEKAVAVEEITPLMEGTFERCRDSDSQSSRYLSVQESGVYDDIDTTYDGANCSGSVASTNFYAGYYYLEGFVSEENGIEIYDVVWGNNPAESVCFTRVGLSDSAMYFATLTDEGAEQELDGCRYDERGMLELDLTEPLIRQ